MQSFVEAREKRRSSRHNDRVEQGLAHINVALLDRIDYQLVDSRPLKADLAGIEQDLGCLLLLA